jgi:hypothetical protein
MRRCADTEDCIFLEGANLCLNQRSCSPLFSLHSCSCLFSAMFHLPACSLLFRVSFPRSICMNPVSYAPVTYPATQLFSNSPHNIHYSYYTFVPIPVLSRDAPTLLVFSNLVNRFRPPRVARIGRSRLDIDEISRTHHESELLVMWLPSFEAHFH